MKLRIAWVPGLSGARAEATPVVVEYKLIQYRYGLACVVRLLSEWVPPKADPLLRLRHLPTKIDN